MSKFKVGDRVRVLRMRGAMTHPIGTIGIVNNELEEHPEFPSDAVVEANDDFWYYTDEDLELVEEATDE